MKALINDSNLHEKTVFGLNEFVDLARFQLGDGTVHIVNVSELINDKYLKIKVKSQTSNFNTESYSSEVIIFEIMQTSTRHLAAKFDMF